MVSAFTNYPNSPSSIAYCSCRTEFRRPTLSISGSTVSLVDWLSFPAIRFHLTMKELYLFGCSAAHAVVRKYIFIYIAVMIWFQSSKEKRLSCPSSFAGSSFVCRWRELLWELASLRCKCSLAFLSTLLAAEIGEEGCEIFSRWGCAPPV